MRTNKISLLLPLIHTIILRRCHLILSSFFFYIFFFVVCVFLQFIPYSPLASYLIVPSCANFFLVPREELKHAAKFLSVAASQRARTHKSVATAHRAEYCSHNEQLALRQDEKKTPSNIQTTGKKKTKKKPNARIDRFLINAIATNSDTPMCLLHRDFIFHRCRRAMCSNACKQARTRIIIKIQKMFLNSKIKLRI